MQTEIKKIIKSMDVKQDKADAEEKALLIFKLGPEALDILVELGESVEIKETDVQIKKKLLRAVIISLSVFAREKSFLKPHIFNNPNAVSLLCRLSSEGYNSAGAVLHMIGFSDSDIQKERLLSLPITDKHLNDKEISVNEAIQEILTAQMETSLNVIKKDCFMIGYSKRHSHEIYRIGKTDFAYRMKRR
ncbi:MAG: hypothetical protein KKE44_05510 [Proteobacteria bacterium]|nr:hypothetical protein [Pseudomonadota bacterium]MBU1582189.1 hypothetical protein [Pseudomonadota bacterium]MBU2631968.1 hypothetical protein [Pseudomonadota bacterium]